jgi:hypothetical protein
MDAQITVKQAQELKVAAGEKIEEIVRDFEDRTGLLVDTINIIHQNIEGRNIKVEIGVSLKNLYS